MTESRFAPSTTFAIGFLVVMSACFAVAWWTAYFSGGHAVVHVNRHGEATAEVVLWMVVVPVVVVGLYRYAKQRL